MNYEKMSERISEAVATAFNLKISDVKKIVINQLQSTESKNYSVQARIYSKKRFHSLRGVIVDWYLRTKKRGVNFTFTKEEIFEYLKNNKNFMEMYGKYVKSEYSPEFRPIIFLKNKTEKQNLSDIYFCPKRSRKSENSINKKKNDIIMFKKNNEVEVYFSTARQASIITGIDQSVISKILSGKLKRKKYNFSYINQNEIIKGRIYD